MAAGKPGPARKPALQVVREGNPGRRPVPREATPPPGIPPEPTWAALVPTEDMETGPRDNGRAAYVRKRASERWHLWVSILNPQGLVSPKYEAELQETALIYAEVEWERKRISVEGSVVKGPQKNWVQNPRWRTVSALRTALNPKIGLLGLAPGAELPAKDASEDPDNLLD